jgi:hypothetical protein
MKESRWEYKIQPAVEEIASFYGIAVFTRACSVGVSYYTRTLSEAKQVDVCMNLERNSQRITT